ncbi:MAG: YraN family protein [Holosporales bacterium]|jgi:putative endonuclease|nr:YraN family protein [Holosporales bacterium]
MNTPTSYQQGLLAEERAACFLESKGYHILHKRFKISVGEIDLIAQDAEYLIFVEVKFRQQMTEALEALSLRQQRRILAAAESFLAENPCFTRHFLRFDVIGMTPTAQQHIEGAFWQEI